MDTARHDRELVRTFSRRMLPLAILFGSLVVLAPTLLMAGLDFERARARSDLYARNLAHEVAKDASRHPYVWRWRIDKVVEGTLAEKEIQHLVYLRVEDCDSEVIFEHGKPAGWPYTWMTSKAKVVTTGGELGTLWVALNPEAASPGRLLIACLSMLIGLLSGLALYHFPVRIVRRQAHAIEETTTHLVHTRLELHQTNLTLQERVDEAVLQIRQLSQRVLAVQDEERARIARELHDGLAQELSALRLDLERAMRTAEDQQQRDLLESASGQCQDALADLRRAIQDLRPVALDAANLMEVIRQNAERFELSTGIAVFVRTQGNVEDLSGMLSASLLRVFQEALHNVERHAQADEIGLSLTCADDEITLEVRDNGVGFETEKLEQPGHGLSNMRARAQLLGGSFEVESTPGEGTTLRFRAPLRG
jgi:signal transduction histidine kinase